MKPPYDTLEGIASYLDSLEGLNRLSDDRLEAGYTRREHLSEFIILGSWYADSCGNFMRIEEPKDARAVVPKVMTREDFHKQFAGTWMRSTMGSNIPPAHVGCAECGQKWSINDCFGIIVKDDTKTLPLTEFIGQPLSAVRAAFEKREDAAYMLGRDLLLRNDKYIDNRPDPDYPSLKLNDGGWKRHSGSSYRKEGINLGEDHIVEPGDEGFFHVWRYLHRQCNEKYQERVYLEHYQEILMEAGLEGPVKAVPNGYCPCEHCGPWVEIASKWGPIEMGWRKRVINIDWSGTGKSLPDLFKDEGVTFGSTYVHAWSKAKAIDYLKRLQFAL